MIYRLLTFMAGVHNVPSGTHLRAAPQDTVRVAFDQNGVIYPASTDAPPIRQPRIGNNYAFSVTHELGRTGYSYGPAQIEESLAMYARTLHEKAKHSSANCIVVLIHGYNNSVKAANTNYEKVRSKLADLSKLRPVFVEVFWDGLHRGPLTLPAPLLYWFDALTYSNLAGQVGLRSLLNRRPSDLPVLFLTHSRGAGVAFSCIADPLYDNRIRVGEHEASNLTSAPSVAAICLAPAVGNGHPLLRVRSKLPINSSLGIGFNTRDPALQKSFIDERFFGDTSFGTNEHSFQDVAKEVNSDDEWLHRSVYENYPKHDLAGYLEHEGGRPFTTLLNRAMTTLKLA
jgi:hypothetical protein